MRAAKVHRGTLAALLGAALVLGQPALAAAKPSHNRVTSHGSVQAASRAGAHKATGPSASEKHVAARRSRPVATARVAQVGLPVRSVETRQSAAATVFTRPLIVIDPGHGGRDPGAIGASGTQEKAVTLAIALELRQALGAGGQYRVAMTRSRDRTVSLSDRLTFARQQDADLLIAIHADASPDRQVRGASVYVSSGQGVRHLAAGSGNSARIAQALSPPESRFEPRSAELQQSMIEQLADDVRMVISPARAGHLYVLGSRSIPSVLLETGFISNREDEALLKQPAHRHRLVGAIRDAIEDYFRGLKAAAPQT
jgi:N-acetylmuramoyl-L-alanine amidase